MSEEKTIQGSWLPIANGHPNGLMTLFFSEMWERFCYYGMRTILMLYLVEALMKGDADAALIYGSYTGLVYAAPILGGRMADKFLGYRYAVMLGAVLMAIGEFLILGGNDKALLVGMGALIIGNGYFKANISTIVGKLYKDNDPRRDSGFTIFYIGINVGALLATLIVGFVGEVYGWNYGFALAGFGMLLGLFIFWSGRAQYAAAPGLDIHEAGKKKILGPLNWVQVITLGSLLLIPLCYLLIQNNGILNYIFLGLFLYVVYTLVTAGIKEDKETGSGIWKDRMIALVIFMLINIVFWAFFEQAGTSLTLFAKRNVNRSIFGGMMPASMTQFFNPAFIIIFGSIFSQMWVRLARKGKNPSIPLKFAYGIIQLGLGFLITYVGYQFAEDNLVPLLTLVFLYLLHTTGELFLSPIGLSMVTKLSPKKIAGTAMGAWFLSFAIANFVGGKIAAFTGGGHGSEEKIDKSVFSDATTVKDAAKMTGTVNFADWPVLAEGVKPNITYGEVAEIKDFVEMREALASDKTLSQFMASRSLGEKLPTASEWLNKEKWTSLGARYAAINKADKATEDVDEISKADWNYFKGDIEKAGLGDNDKLGTALDKLKDYVQGDRLARYVDIFTKIGLLLLAFAGLIIILNRPIKKLMHGVE